MYRIIFKYEFTDKFNLENVKDKTWEDGNIFESRKEAADHAIEMINVWLKSENDRVSYEIVKF